MFPWFSHGFPMVFTWLSYGFEGFSWPSPCAMSSRKCSADVQWPMLPRPARSDEVVAWSATPRNTGVFLTWEKHRTTMIPDANHGAGIFTYTKLGHVWFMGKFAYMEHNYLGWRILFIIQPKQPKPKKESTKVPTWWNFLSIQPKFQNPPKMEQFLAAARFDAMSSTNCTPFTQLLAAMTAPSSALRGSNSEPRRCRADGQAERQQEMVEVRTGATWPGRIGWVSGGRFKNRSDFWLMNISMWWWGILLGGSPSWEIYELYRWWPTIWGDSMAMLGTLMIITWISVDIFE